MSRSAERTTTDYKLTEEVDGSFFGTGPSGHQVLVVPTTADRAPLDRSTGNIALSFKPQVFFELHEKKFQAPAAILTCLSDALSATFGVLATDIATKVNVRNDRPMPMLVSRLFAAWEELLRRRRSLSEEEEIGLWGELWFLLETPSIDRAIAVWRGPAGEVVDFVGGGIGVDCKTTMRRLEHHFSQLQLDRARGDLPVYFLSLWLDRDEVGGRTLNDMVNEVAEACGDPGALERVLLQVGYSRQDSLLYAHKFRVLEAPLWFEERSVPRVRVADPGISAIRFLATLDQSAALNPERGIALLAKVCGGTNAGPT